MQELPFAKFSTVHRMKNVLDCCLSVSINTQPETYGTAVHFSVYTFQISALLLTHTVNLCGTWVKSWEPSRQKIHNMGAPLHRSMHGAPSRTHFGLVGNRSPFPWATRRTNAKVLPERQKRHVGRLAGVDHRQGVFLGALGEGQ